eukprot:366421-Chlamydomonas_euryale.AAC.10
MNFTSWCRNPLLPVLPHETLRQGQPLSRTSVFATVGGSKPCGCHTTITPKNLDRKPPEAKQKSATHSGRVMGFISGGVGVQMPTSATTAQTLPLAACAALTPSTGHSHAAEA